MRIAMSAGQQISYLRQRLLSWTTDIAVARSSGYDEKVVAVFTARIEI
jgi:hypothetical protein